MRGSEGLPLEVAWPVTGMAWSIKCKIRLVSVPRHADANNGHHIKWTTSRIKNNPCANSVFRPERDYFGQPRAPQPATSPNQIFSAQKKEKRKNSVKSLKPNAGRHHWGQRNYPGEGRKWEWHVVKKNKGLRNIIPKINALKGDILGCVKKSAKFYGPKGWVAEIYAVRGKLKFASLIDRNKYRSTVDRSNAPA